jgi:hypothetical protein
MSATLILQDGKNLAAFKDAATVVHDQRIDSNVWSIPHQLGKFPSVTCVEATGRVMFGQVDYISSELLTVTFNVVCSGKAYLN